MCAANCLTDLLGGGVFGDGLGAFRHCVLGQLTGQKQTDCSLDFPAADGRALVVVCQTAGFSCDSFEDVVDERVHDRHGLGADTGVGVHLLQHFVNVDGEGFFTFGAALALLVCWRSLLDGLLGTFRCNHLVFFVVVGVSID